MKNLKGVGGCEEGEKRCVSGGRERGREGKPVWRGEKRGQVVCGTEMKKWEEGRCVGGGSAWIGVDRKKAVLVRVLREEI